MNIPLDVLLMIVDILDVKSIVCLSMVNKEILRQIEETRLVWLRALHHILQEECVAPYSLPISTMTTQELRAVATRPYRLSHSIIHDSIPFLSSFEFSFHFGPHPESGEWEWMHRTPIFLPGGRWVVNHASDGQYLHIFCWDLSMLSEELELHPVASLKASFAMCEDVGDLQVEMDVDALRLVILLMGSTWDWEEKFNEVFYLSWTDDSADTPILTSQTALHIHDSVQLSKGIFRLSGDFVYGSTDSRITIWNWRLNTLGAIATMSDPELSSTMYNVWVQPPNLFAMPSLASKILVHSIPELQPTSNVPIPLVAQWKSFPLSRIALDPRYSDHTMISPWKPPERRINQVRVHNRQSSTDPGAFIFLDTSSTLADAGDLDRASLSPLRTTHDEALFPLHSESHAHRLASGLFVTIQKHLDHAPTGSSTGIRAYPYSNSSRHQVKYATLRTDIPINKRSQAEFKSEPCAISGRFLVNVRYRGSHQWESSYALLTFD